MRRFGPRLVATSGLALLVLCGAAVIQASPAQAVTTKTVTVQVVPHLGGVHFSIDGVAGVTDDNGQATIEDPQLNNVGQRLVLPQQVISPTVRVTMDRFNNNPDHGAFTRALLVELDVEHLVGVRFLTPKGETFAGSKVTSATFRDSLGRAIVWTGPQLITPNWVMATRPVRVSNGIKGSVITYALQSVMIKGSSVVNQGQQRFTATDSLIWDIPVALFSLTITGNDLLSGKPIGKNFGLTYPDQSTIVRPLGPGHTTTVHNLPPGDYQVKVTGGLVAPKSTVHLSRSDSTTSVVITKQDFLKLLAVVVFVLGVLVGIGFLGRRLRRKHVRATAGNGADASAH